jgi:hypothetical protein
MSSNKYIDINVVKSKESYRVNLIGRMVIEMPYDAPGHEKRGASSDCVSALVYSTQSDNPGIPPFCTDELIYSFSIM